MSVRSLALLVVACLFTIAHAAAADVLGPLEVTAEFTAPAAGTAGQLFIRAEIPGGWHTFSITQPAGGPLRTIISIPESDQYRIGEFSSSPPPHLGMKPDVWPNVRIEEHFGHVIWSAPLELSPGVEPSDLQIEGKVQAQRCEEGNCVPRTAFPFVAKLGAGMALAGDAPAPAASGNAGNSLLVMMGFGFIGGIILNLMPCVLPVIGLKILSFVQQSGQDRRRILALNIWYSLGVFAVFMVLATLAAGAKLGLTQNDLGWGQQFGSTAFNVVMSSVVFVMALSFLGVWEIPIPGFVTTGKANDVAAREGAAGAFSKGALSTVLATPCSGPFLGPVFGFTLTQPPAGIYALFASIGLGMAAPYLAIGAFPALIRFLPKPGAWMDTFKHIMGFVLLGTIVFLFTFLTQGYVVPTFAFLIGLWFACWWIGRTTYSSTAGEKARAWGIGVATASVVGLFAFNVLVPHKPLLPWRPYSRATLARLSAEGKTVMVDFSANWCLSCKTNLKFSIDRPAVNELVKQNRVVPLLADWTDGSDEIAFDLEKLQSKSIPVLAIYSPDKLEQPIILRDLVTKGQVIDALKQAGPSSRTGRSRLEWQPFSRELLEQNLRAKRTVMVQIGASDDLTTEYNLTVSLDSAEVEQAVEKSAIVTLLADSKTPVTEVKAELDALHSKTAPVLAIFPAEDPKQPIVLHNLLTVEQVLEAIKRAGPSQEFAASDLEGDQVVHEKN